MANENGIGAGASVLNVGDMSPGQRRHVLIVDDDLEYVQTLATALQAKGHKVHIALNATVALAVADRFQPDTVLLDLKMPGLRGTWVEVGVDAD